MAGIIKVPSELVPSQSNKIMLRSKYIYDDVKGHTQEEVNAALEEQIESKVIEAGGVNWDTVPTAGSNNAVKSKDIKAALEKVTGYFVLDSNVLESTVAKTVTVADFPALAIGGSIKIKMLTKNTAANPTLKIGPASATAYPLYYNEERASANNSWEANEIISVFFDGANYRASNSQGGSNKKLDTYLYGDVKSLLVGNTYNIDEAVKTTDKQFRRITKEIKVLSLSETLTAGDIKTSGNATYRVDDTVDIYNPEGDYSENPYALGSLAEYIFTVTAESITAGNITVNETEIAVEETDDANSVATKIADALVIDGWTTSVANNVVTVKCNTIGNNTTTITIDPDTENTGITVDESSIAGTNVIRKYDGESWANADVPTMETDGIIISVDEVWLIENATKQNTLDKDVNWIDSLENSNGDFTWLTGNVTKYGDLVNTTSNKYAIFSKTALGENVTSFTIYCGGISGKSFWLYYQSGNKWYSKSSIKVGYTEFNVSNQSNFLILSYDNPTISQMEKCDIRVFRKTIVKDTVKDHESRITDLENNLSTEDVNYSSTVYTNDNNDFSWKTGNPSNPSAPSYANKYFTLNTGVEISKIKLVKTSSSYTFGLWAKVGNSYISLFSGKTSQNGIVDVTGKGYKVIYGLLWDKPSDSAALAENITIEVTSNLRSKLDSMDASIAQAGGTYFTNPVIQSDSPDPAVWWGEDGYWYLLATGNLSTKTMWRSANLVDWENTGETPFTQTAIETWTNLGNGGFWAPEIVKVGDKWNIYLSAGQNPMYVFTSKFPTYGFEYVGVIADHVLTLENIDACVRYDRDGTLWMFFDSYRQGMYRVKLNETGTQMISGTMEHVAGLANDAEGNTNRAKTYEGAYLYRRKGYWYLIVSAGKYQDASYCLRVGRSATLDGTFVDKNGNLMAEGNASLLLSASGTFYGTGHNGSIITDKQNRTWMLFHSHWTGASSTSARPTCISEVLWDEDGWPYFTNNTLTVEGYGPKM